MVSLGGGGEKSVSVLNEEQNEGNLKYATKARETRLPIWYWKIKNMQTELKAWRREREGIGEGVLYLRFAWWSLNFKKKRGKRRRTRNASRTHAQMNALTSSTIRRLICWQCRLFSTHARNSGRAQRYPSDNSRNNNGIFLFFLLFYSLFMQFKTQGTVGGL